MNNRMDLRNKVFGESKRDIPCVMKDIKSGNYKPDYSGDDFIFKCV